MDLQAVKRRFGIIGNTDKLNGALGKAMQVAPTDLTVLITGESGVGKEVFSSVIHQLSHRKHNKLIAVNCGAIPEGTIDSELFGHEKGAFTGAHEKRKGYFEYVDQGTIFLDEISEMPTSTQARLLRVLESGEFMKVGSSTVQKTDVRVIAATNRDLFQLIDSGKFREDLYYRLNTVPIFIPPLRERKTDIYLLFRKFCVDFAERYGMGPVELDEEAKALLEDYRWPGNIRQLKHVAEQMSALHPDKIINGKELLHYIPEAEQSNLPVLSDKSDKKQYKDENFEREILYRVLFELRQDVNDLKKVVLDLLQEDTDNQKLSKQKASLLKDWHREVETGTKGPETDEMKALSVRKEDKPVVISSETEQDKPYNKSYKAEEVVEESLSIAEKEKELIVKALHKHSGKRKEAALDLGISERTLYRKIKEYNLD